TCSVVSSMISAPFDPADNEIPVDWYVQSASTPRCVAKNQATCDPQLTLESIVRSWMPAAFRSMAAGVVTLTSGAISKCCASAGDAASSSASVSTLLISILASEE